MKKYWYSKKIDSMYSGTCSLQAQLWASTLYTMVRGPFVLSKRVRNLSILGHHRIEGSTVCVFENVCTAWARFIAWCSRSLHLWPPLSLGSSGLKCKVVLNRFWETKDQYWSIIEYMISMLFICSIIIYCKLYIHNKIEYWKKPRNYVQQK